MFEKTKQQRREEDYDQDGDDANDCNDDVQAELNRD